CARPLWDGDFDYW
nr:immunoglobulin heavy chain junction region [Mus musculus]